MKGVKSVWMGAVGEDDFVVTIVFRDNTEIKTQTTSLENAQWLMGVASEIMHR